MYDKRAKGVILNIEPLPTEYCEYINSIEKANELAESYENVEVQLDTRTLIEQKINSLPKDIDFKHCQIGDPEMCFHDSKFDHFHIAYSDALKNMGYSGYISAEVLCQEGYSNLSYLKIVANKMSNLYG